MNENVEFLAVRLEFLLLSAILGSLLIFSYFFSALVHGQVGTLIISRYRADEKL